MGLGQAVVVKALSHCCRRLDPQHRVRDVEPQLSRSSARYNTLSPTANALSARPVPLLLLRLRRQALVHRQCSSPREQSPMAGGDSCRYQ